VRGAGSGADVPRKYRITRRIWRVRHWRGIHSRCCCRLHHWPRAGAVGVWPSPLWHWAVGGKHAKVAVLTLPTETSGSWRCHSLSPYPRLVWQKQCCLLIIKISAKSLQ
jgi:hypothetical protein